MIKVTYLRFKTFLEELRSKGTYVEIKPTEEEAQKLLDFVHSCGIKKTVDARDIHATVIYSKTPCPDITPREIESRLPISAKISRWSVFGSENKCLVLELESPGLEKLNNYLVRMHAATSDFDVYRPHVTISYDAIPSSVDNLPSPDFSIKFDRFSIKSLED